MSQIKTTRNNHVLQTLKRLKATLENDKNKYSEKVNILVMTWERIAASAREQRPLAAICIVEKMYKDTLNIVLQGEWPKTNQVSKTHLIQMLNRCKMDLCKDLPWLQCKFKKLIELVNDPWSLPSLKRILHRDPGPATPEQILEFCESERGLLIVTRLAMLCSNRLEKLAIKLAEACFSALSSNNSLLLNRFTKEEYNYVFDIYLCLLYKYKKLELIIQALVTFGTSVSEGHNLVERLKRRSDLHEQKIWKYGNQVSAIAARYFVTISMRNRTVPDSSVLKDLIKDWLSMYNSLEENNFSSTENEIQKIMQPAETSEHIYIMAEVLTAMSQEWGNEACKAFHSLIMELYIRALTADVNFMERIKLQNDKEQMTAHEKHLAAKFLALADLMKDHGGVRREFVLTAFSIHPSEEIYKRVEEEAVASGKASPHSTPTSQESLEVGVLSEGLSSLSSEEPDVKETAIDYSLNNDSQDSGAFVEISNRCPLHPPYDGVGPEGELCFQCGDFTGSQTPRSPKNPKQTKKERSLDALILIKGNTVTESSNYDVLSAPSQVLEAEKLGLSPQVCADLVTLIGSNRYHLLTWVLEWGELSDRCQRYMEEADTIKSGKKELKFLDIDYSQFKNLPAEQEEEYEDCIEKGYEHWLEDDESDFDTDSKRSNTDDSEEMHLLKTAIKRSQKHTGRYAESSSDSEDSRARSRPRKRGRPRKKPKYQSDSGSVSDSLGSDGQKQKRSSKKPRTKSKDLRKQLGTMKVLEMANETGLLYGNNGAIPPELLNSNFFNLASSVRSDPTVLKSLRAFRPNNPQKSAKPEDYNVAAMYHNPKVFNPNHRPLPGAFDCNDNKFITKDNSLSAIGSADLEMHFRSSGVKTKHYNNDFYRIKEDLISINNIPNFANHATVNVVHVNEGNKVDGGQNAQSTSSEAGGSQTNRATEVAKAKPEGSRKPASSQVISQEETKILSSVLSRASPTSRVGMTNLTGRIIAAQPQYMTIINRNSLNQAGTAVRTAGQNVITQINKPPQTPRTNAAANQSITRLLLEGERPNVISNRNYVPVQQGRIQQNVIQPAKTTVRYVTESAQAVNRTYVAAKPAKPQPPKRLVNSPASPKNSEVTSTTITNFENRTFNKSPYGEVANVMVSQSSSRNTIHYTVVDPPLEDLNSLGDMSERVKNEEYASAPRTVMSPENPVEEQIIILPRKSESSPSQSAAAAAADAKKSVFNNNNQKITMVVHNNDGGNSVEVFENPQGNNKLSELLFRDDQKTCITFRAIKRGPDDGGGIRDEIPNKKKPTSDRKDLDGSKSGENSDGTKNESNETCEYLVLESVTDPSGTLPKFNQAFGKSYQIKIPQPIKPVEEAGNGESDELPGIFEAKVLDSPVEKEEVIIDPVPTSVPLQPEPAQDSSSGGGRNTLELVKKSVYIEKDVKTVKNEEVVLDSSQTKVQPTIQVTQIQQPGGLSTFQSVPKLARSTVVQQLLRKVPTTGPSTLQAVSTINTVTSRQVKTQDVVSGPTLIYTTTNRAQSQIVIQRAVGRVNAPTISQVAPVIYAQQPNDQAAPAQTQTLLLAAVPTGTRGVVPGTQLVRLPSNSGVWRMAPSVNTSRIVQLRPQNLVLQGGQEQGLLMQTGQPLLLHHLTSLPVKPIGVVANAVKPDQTVKLDLKGGENMYNKTTDIEDAKICSVPLEVVDESPIKNEASSSPVAAASEHETVALMKDIKEFENVFEETKLKFEMEEQQGVCLPEVETVIQTKPQPIDVRTASPSQPTHQTVLVQPQLMLHKPQMIITSAGPNQQAIFGQKIEKQIEPEKRLLLATKPKREVQLGTDENSQSHVTVAYVSHAAASAASIQKPLVVVTSYGQPPSSPAPSITSQSSSSPNSVVGPSSLSGVKTQTKTKSRSVKTVPNPSKSPPVAKPQQKPQEDANTAQKIYAILEEYAVQLRNSPDMNNRPAPRRRSNPPTSANPKRKKTVCKSKESFSDGDDANLSEDVTEPLPSSEDSSSGVTVLQVCVSTSH